MRFPLIVVFALCVVAVPVLGQSAANFQQHRADEFITYRKATPATLQARASRVFDIDPKRLGESFHSASQLRITEFPVSSNQNLDLELTIARPVVDARTQVWVGSSAGSIPAPVPNITSFRGTIRGERGSAVFLNVVDGMIIGMIRRGDGSQYVVGPCVGAGTVAGRHVLVKESDYNFKYIENMIHCQSDGTTNYSFAGKRVQQNKLFANKLLETEIAVEVDSAFYARSGGSTALATAYIASLFSMVSSIYEDEINVTFHITWVKVWSNNDPYNVNGNGYTLFNLVPPYWKANYQNVQRDLVHVMTASDWGGGGIGYRGQKFESGVSVFCNSDYGYSVSSPRCVLNYPTFTFTYDAYIVAHEIGHNFGARHTHDCWWNPPLDTCQTKDDASFQIGDACFSLPITPRPSPGTIMSYCMGINQKAGGGQFDSFKVAMTFSPRVASVMRQEAELATTCLTEPTAATVILTNPRGAIKEYKADSTVEIRWTSANVSNIMLQYSDNGGTSWKTIATGLPAPPGSYQWKVPNICAKSVLVRIQDAAKFEVADTSLLPFAIAGYSAKLSSITASHDTLTVTAGKAYQWYVNGNVISGATGRSHIAAVSGVYTVIVTDSAGCQATSAPFTYVKSAVPNEVSSAIALGITLDPMQQHITVRFMLVHSGMIRVRIFNNTGAELQMLASGHREAGMQTIEGNIEALPSGSYFIRVETDGVTETRKVTVGR